MIPQVFARLLHYHGTDAKLRAFRHERWIPAKWTNLHQLYAKAIGRELRWDDSVFGYQLGDKELDLSFDKRDSAAFAPLGGRLSAHYRRKVNLARASEPGAGRSASGSLLLLGGAIGRVGENDTAYGHRDAAFDFMATADWTDPSQDGQQMAAPVPGGIEHPPQQTLRRCCPAAL